MKCIIGNFNTKKKATSIHNIGSTFASRERNGIRNRNIQHWNKHNLNWQYRQYICVMSEVVEEERIWDKFRFRFRHACRFCRFAGIFYRPDTHNKISAVWIRTYKTSKQLEILKLLFQCIIVKEQKVYIILNIIGDKIRFLYSIITILVHNLTYFPY